MNHPKIPGLLIYLGDQTGAADALLARNVAWRLSSFMNAPVGFLFDRENTLVDECRLITPQACFVGSQGNLEDALLDAQEKGFLLLVPTAPLGSSQQSQIAEGSIQVEAQTLTELIRSIEPEQHHWSIFTQRLVLKTGQGFNAVDGTDFEHLTSRLFAKLVPDWKRISVIVPNFNHAPYIAERLNSIFGQSYPLHELIILDDASTDESCSLITQQLATSRRGARLMFSASNCGHVFSQWRRGLERASGDYIWIAESDDSAHPILLERLIETQTEGEELAFVFCDSESVDATGKTTSFEYRNYLASISDPEFTRGVRIPGEEFHQRYLSVRNLVLNASSVLWSAAHLRRAMVTAADQLPEFQCAGDWLLYITACHQDSPVAFVPESLNIHRKHSASVTFSQDRAAHLAEVAAVHAVSLKYLAYPQRLVGACQDYVVELALEFGLRPELAAPQMVSGAEDDAPTAPVASTPGLLLPLDPLRRRQALMGNSQDGTSHWVHPISVDVEIARKSGTCGADASLPKLGWFDSDTCQLALELQLVLVFPDEDILSLEVTSYSGERHTLQSTRPESPGIAKLFPEQPWAIRNRFLVKDCLRIAPPDGEPITVFARTASREIPVAHVHPAALGERMPGFLTAGFADLLLVQGMHRSGTSLATQLCGELGFAMPPDLMPANKWNPNGYFESTAVVNAHQTLLTALDRRWYDIRSLPSNWLASYSASVCESQLTDVLKPWLNAAQETQGVIKDPRLAQLSPLWSRIAQSQGLRLSHLVVLRPVHEVVASLMARDHISPRVAVAMWWVNITAILRHARSQSHALVTHAKLISAPMGLGSLLVRRFGYALTAPEHGRLSALVDPRLHHHRGPIPELENDALAQRCDALYEQLQDLDSIPDDLDLDSEPPEIAEILGWYSEWEALFAHSHELLERTRSVRDQLSRLVD